MNLLSLKKPKIKEKKTRNKAAKLIRKFTDKNNYTHSYTIPNYTPIRTYM